MADKIDLASVTYVLGILSIVFAFFSSWAGLVLGIIGLVQSKKQNVPKAKLLNKIGIILSIILIVFQFVLVYALTAYCANNPGAVFCQGLFPIA